MTWKKRLLWPLPPGVDRSDPNIINWRLDQHQEILEHLNDTKLDRPHFNPSLSKAAGVALIYALGLIGLLSPDRAEWLIGLLGSR